MAKVLSGKDVAAALNEKIKTQVADLKANGTEPTLAILRVGEAPDQISYEKGATKRCADTDVAVKNVVLPEESTTEEVLAALTDLNEDPAVHGILLLQPLPKHIDGNLIRNSIVPEKDADCAADGTLGASLIGKKDAFAPCTAQACIEILDYYDIPIEGKKAVVLGRSLVIGKPVAMLLLGRNATVTICHSRTKDLPAVAAEADILIAAIGRDYFVTKDFASADQTIIDVGINWNEEESKLHGDVNYPEVEPLVDAITPVPGGVGAVTTSVLVSHVVESAARA